MARSSTSTTKKQQKKQPSKQAGAAADDRPTLYLIDGHAQIFRAYHAIRSLNSPVTSEPTNATFGFVGMLLKLFRDVDPEYVAVAIDVGSDRETFRQELYSDYKANRDEMPDDLPPQIQRILEICERWGIPVLGAEGFEADDVIATLCGRLAENDGLNIRIVSRDKDLEQLIGPRVALYDIHKDETVDRDALQDNRGLTPDQVIDALALMGDKVDNIPGVPGIGPKTAAKLVSQFGSLDEVLNRTDELSGKLKDKIEQMRDQLTVNRELVTLRYDAPVEFDLESADVPKPPPIDELQPLFKELGFNRHLNDLNALAGKSGGAGGGSEAGGTAGGTAARQRRSRASDEAAEGLFASLDTGEEDGEPAPSPYNRPDPSNYRAITTAEELDELAETLRQRAEAGQPVSVDTETDQLDPMRANLCGISFSWEEGQGVYVPVRSSEPEAHLDPDTVLAKLGPMLEDSNLSKVGQNLKYDMVALRRAGIYMTGVAEGGFDTMVASYLIDATRSSHKLDNLALAHLDLEMVPITELIGTGRKQKSMVELPVATVAPYAAEDSDVALRLRNHFEPQLKAMGLTELFAELEMPLVEILAELEYNGILVDPDELDRQKAGIDTRIAELYEKIIDTAGVEFNPDSPKQLADVLFKTLGCTALRRGKTGPSTDSEVLNRIANEQEPPGSEVAALILEYRQLTKLRNTYLEALKQAIHPETDRIHASFNQTVTATGRLSSSDPNLQNIPIRTELGRQIRRAFVAPEGKVLLAADYSQIELRLLAHLSGDERLIEAFRKDLDVHTAVAAEVFGVELEQVTSEQRNTAKIVNYGIVYGVTPHGLARRMPREAAGSRVEVAKQIIEDYKQRYPRIDHFLSECVETAEARGYVETINKRRRSIPEVRSNNGNTVALGKRMAINTVVQGSAADLIKAAMVRTHHLIREQQRPMHMLLQIHDELVFEVPEEEAEAQAAFLREQMTRAMELTVPLAVEIAWGRDWFQSK